MTFKSEKALEQRLKRPSSILSCHFCGNQWDCRNRCFVCPRCHTVYNPQKSPLIGFGGEVRVARMRVNISGRALAKIIGCSLPTIERIERGVRARPHPRGKIIREKLRIWIESTKPPLDRHQEIDQMFKTRKRRKKVKENG